MLNKFPPTPLSSIQRFVLLMLMFFALTPASAQKSKDGAETVTTAGVIFNRYATLASTATTGATSITVGNISDLAAAAIAGAANNPYATGALSPCDLLMIIKMQGATMTTTNTAAYGTITNYNNVGVYEFVEVGSIAGNVITFSAGCSLNNTYTVGGTERIQVVRVPRLSSLTINAAASLTGRAWGQTAGTGGVVVVEVNGNTVVNGSITASGIGYRGGAIDNDANNPGNNIYTSTSSFDGGEKGEGIVGYQTDYDGLTGRYGRGAPGNGGGGGNAHNAGGGGGSNGDNGVAYTGTGNPDVSGGAVWIAAWNLEVAGFATSVSSGGGRGGYTFGSTDQVANTTAPGNAAWGGDNRTNRGGFGGKPLNYNSNTRLFMGGGGGAGDGNNNANADGGDGGGIVYVISYGNVSGTGSITANGQTAPNTIGGHNDAPGGGGGGGAVAVFASGTITGIAINANGGGGGNQLITGAESEGPGGGGGGGYVCTTTTAIIPTVNAGANGTTSSSAVTEFTPNGATRGATGVVVNNATFPAIADKVDISVVTTVSPGPYCVGSAVTYTVVLNNSATTCNTATGVAVNIPAPAGVTVTTVTPSTGTYTTPTWTVGALNANTSATITIVGTINSASFGGLTATATTSSSECVAANNTSSVGVLVTNTPTTSNAGPDQTICSTGGSATMAGNVAVTGTGVWTQVSGPTTATITTPASPVTTITAMTTAGTYVFQWTISNAPCTASSDQISVIVNAPPTTANAGPDQTICANTATMAGNAPTVGTGTWTQISGPVTGTITTPSSPTTTITGLTTAGTYVFQWTITNTPCSASSDQVQIIRNGTPTTANAGPDQTICSSGGSATMAGNVAVTGTGVWTQVSGPTTATITTPASPVTTITAMTTAGTYVFQWTISNAPCPPSSDQISVIVNAPPTAANAGPDASVCGLTATLAGNTAATGTGTWTLVAGPGTAVFTNANSPTSNVTVSIVGVYTFRWTIANAPCTASQDNVIITFVASPTVANAGPDQTICTTVGSAVMAGNVAATGTGAWTQVSGPVTATITTPASPVTTITGMTTAGTYVFQWTISNAPCTATSDQISVIVNAPPTTANAGPDQTICSNTATMAGNTPTVGTGTWTQISGPVTGTITTPGSPTTTITGLTTAGTYVFQWTITNAPCSASSDQVQIIRNGTPTTSNAGPDQTICSTVGTATMAGNVAVVGTGVWTQVSGPATATITTPASPITTVTALTTAGTYVFQWTISNAPCTPSTDQVSIIVNAPPTAANAGPDQTICSNSTSMAGNTPAIGTGTWTFISGPATPTITTPSSPTTTITGVTIAGTYVFQWTITNAPCSASSDQVQIIRNATTPAANAGPDQSLCSAVSATMAGNVATPGVGTWTQVSGPNSATITTPNSPTTTMTGLITGVYTFQWTITNAPCPSTSDQVVVTIATPPTTSNAGPDQAVCGTSTTMAGNTAAIGTGTWTQVSGPNSATITTPGSPTTTMTGLIAGTYVFQWTISNSPCTASSDQVSVVVSAAPTTANAGIDQTICSTTGAATMAGNNPAIGTGTWTQVSGPITATITTPSSETSTITGLTTAGTYIFQWTITNGSCPSSSDQVSIFVNDPPTASAAGPDQTLCASTTATMVGNIPTTGTGTWTQVSGPNSATITTPSSETTTMTGLIAGTYVFQWTITNAPCAASSDQVTVTVDALPTTSNAGVDQTICSTSGTATMAANVATTGTGVWTQVSGPVTATITTPSSEVSTITGMTSAGTYVFQWTITNGSCPSSSDQVSVFVNDPPTTSAAGPDQTLCASTTATMAGNIPTTGTGTWTQVSGPNTATITTPTSESTTITGLITGTYVFQWDIANAPCAVSSDQVTVVIDSMPTVANAGVDQTLCSTNGTATMAANLPTVGTGAWTQVSGPATATITTPSSETSTITGLTTAGTYIFQWTITNGVCPSSSDQMQIDVFDPPIAAAAGPDQALCNVTTITMAANTVVVGGGMWTQVSGPNTATITTPTSENTTITGLIAGTYIFQWTISNGPCVPSSDQVQIDIYDLPTTANAGTDQAFCNLTSTTMAANTPTVGTGLWSQVSGPNSATITTPTSENTTMTNLVSGTYVFVWTITNGVCAPSTDTVNVVVDALPTVAAAGADMLNVCPPTITMAGNAPVNGVGLWSQVSGPNSANIVTPSSATTTINGLTPGTYIFVWTITSGTCGFTSDTIQVVVISCDADGDGIADNIDPDDDNDGILDVVEGTGDTDGDGIPNYLDLDSDNDGIPDVIESGGSDPDGDGVIGTGPIVDTDGDGLSDIVDPDNGGTPLVVIDTDGDGVPNIWDLDSDNDGITDVTEAGGIDANGDGHIDGYVDTDGDGFADSVDSTTGGTALPTVDSDGDGHANYVDLDSDNDGIPDVVESGGTDANGDGIIDGYVDSNGNGLADSVDPAVGGTPLVLIDTDGDGISNYLDLDSDNDGITDVTEAGGIDANGDGHIDGYVDTDNDGLSDNVDTNNGGIMLPVPDTDGDGYPNYLDLDSDNDGITDVAEAGGTDANGDGIIDLFADTNGNGLSDNVDPAVGGTPLLVPDTDGDGHANYVDLDSDNDGITDVTEAGGVDANGDGIIDGYTDTDNDGLSDNVDTNNGGVMLSIPDTDNDGHANYVDLDSDNDGITDVTEAGGTDANGDGHIDGYVDTDNDGLSDNVDTNNGGIMLTIPNTDGDGLPNYLDLDSDNDGITDVSENGGADADGDGHIDGYVDANGNGYADSADPSASGTPFLTADQDGDGHPNYLDLDSDNDGIVDIIEVGGTDADNNGLVDGTTDSDNDGLIDTVDPSASGTPEFTTGADTNNDGRPDSYPNDNFDNSGLPNYLDIDADNDGIVDIIEGQSTAGYIAPSGNDTDGDGIDDAFDTINGFGGAGITPVNTDGTDTPDYIDLDTDNDGFSDIIEGNDFNNDNTPDVVATGNDADNDGLDDAYDVVSTNGTGNVTNNDGPPTATTFPDVDVVGGELDWRDPLDSDGDGIVNSDDIDDDNDGILDVVENATASNGGDTDHDGIPDSLDLDSDNDGIPDVIEAGGTDPDNDGVIGTGPITDANNDGLDDSLPLTGLNPPDTDGDGHPNYQDLDSDNDGITDLTESGGNLTDANHDGVVDGADTDHDGLPDAEDATNSGTLTGNPIDSDGDGHPDYLDLDSDNDGIADVTEGGSPDTNHDGHVDNFTDTNNDGLDDTVASSSGNAGTQVPDWDNDGHPDYLDLDSDNDGIADITEGGSPDVNHDGHVDNFTDTNNDGLDDTIAATTGNGGLAVPDSDGDGHPDYLDLDSDNDGIADVLEGGSPDVNGDGHVDNFTDTNNDGLDDFIASSTGIGGLSVPDSDGDGHPDYLDLDSDNDGIADILEGGSPDVNNDGHVDNFTDTDGDGWDDNIQNGSGPGGPSVPDWDGDGHPDYLDLDSDNDGISDVLEGGSPDVDGDGHVDNFTDTNGDGWDDNVENGTGNGGPGVPDTDGDGHPDYLDLDSDNDGIPDILEGGSPDVDGDGHVDNFTDNNGDGWDDNIENGNGNAGPGVPDTDGDGIPDYLDLDSDNDGITDAIEGGGADANGDGIIDNFTDTNGDGWDDNTQTGSGPSGPGVPDTDGDGIPNYQDTDSDGDGIPDGTGDEVAIQDCDGDGISNYLDPDPCNLVVPQGFSPNADGINDIFEIKGINAYPNNNVTIFNRWGNLVYEGSGYDNTNVKWDGTNAGKLSTGSGPVPEGTYFYVIDLGDGSPVLSGYVFVNRQ